LKSNESNKVIFWFLFYILLLSKEAGNAFVETKLRTTKNQHKKVPVTTDRDFCFKYEK